LGSWIAEDLTLSEEEAEKEEEEKGKAFQKKISAAFTKYVLKQRLKYKRLAMAEKSAASGFRGT